MIGGRGAQGQRRDLPEVQAAVEGRLHELPVADDTFLGVPTDRVGLVVCPDAERIAVFVGLAVAMGDDDVADLELRDFATDFRHFADGGVAGIDLAAAEIGDVDRVRRRRVGEVVFGGNGEGAELDVPGADVWQRRGRRAQITLAMSMAWTSSFTRARSVAMASAVMAKARVIRSSSYAAQLSGG